MDPGAAGCIALFLHVQESLVFGFGAVYVRVQESLLFQEHVNISYPS